MIKQIKSSLFLTGFCFAILLNTNNIYAIGLANDFADSYGHHIYSGSFGAAIFENLCGEARNEFSASENVIGYVKVEDFFNNQTDEFSSLKQIYKSTGENQLDEVHIMGYNGRGTDYINNTINDALKDVLVQDIATDTNEQYVKVVSNVFEINDYFDFLKSNENNADNNFNIVEKLMTSDNISLEMKQAMLDECGEKIESLSQKIENLNQVAENLSVEKDAYRNTLNAVSSILKADPVHTDIISSIENCINLAIAIHNLEQITGLEANEILNMSVNELSNLKDETREELSDAKHKHDNLIDKHNQEVDLYNNALDTNNNLVGDTKDSIDDSNKFYSNDNSNPTSNNLNVLNKKLSNKKNSKK